MPSELPAFDPYHKWLGIAPKDQPPHHYRLLGIEPFESDAEVIDSAAKQRMVFLAAHATGPHANRAADLVSQVAAARACLLNPQSRADYDAQLRTRQVKPKPQPMGRAPSAAWRESPAARPVPVAVALEPASDQEVPSFATKGMSATSTARKAQIKRKAAQRQFRVGIVGQMLASVVGLAIGYWIISSVDPRFDFLHLRAGGDVAERPPQAPQADDRTRESNRPGPTSPRKSGVTTTAAADGQAKHAGDPSTATDEKSAAAAAPVTEINPFLNLPPAIALPPLGNGAPAAAATLVKLDRVPSAAFDVLLKTYVTSAKVPRIFRVQRSEASGPSESSPQQWRVFAQAATAADTKPADTKPADAKQADAKKAPDSKSSGPKPPESTTADTPVAELALTGDSLTFAWLPEAHTTYSEALRNCVLTLRAGTAEKSLRLRMCEHADAVRLGMDKSYVQVPLPEGDFSPPPEALRLQLLQADDLPFGATFIPDSKLVGSGDEIRIVLRSEVPAVELRARLFTSGKTTSIRVAPVIADAAGKPLPFTLDMLNSKKQATTKDIANAEKASTVLSQRMKLIAAEIPRLRTTVVPSVTAANRIKAQIAALEAESANAAVEVARLDKLIPEMKTRLQLFDPLFALAHQVRNATKLHFRVFFVCEEQEVDVLKAG